MSIVAVMHLKTKANSLYVKSYMAINLIQIFQLREEKNNFPLLKYRRLGDAFILFANKHVSWRSQHEDLEHVMYKSSDTLSSMQVISHLVTNKEHLTFQLLIPHLMAWTLAKQSLGEELPTYLNNY